MGFAPTLETNVQPLSPVSGPNISGAVGNLLGTFLGGSSAPKAPPSPTELKDQSRQGFFTAMDEAAQLREQGKEDQAVTREREAYRAWTRQYGAGTDPEVDSAFERATGINPNIETSGKTDFVESTRNSKEYNEQLTFVTMNNPDMSPAQQDAEAMRRAANAISVNTQLTDVKQRESVTWVEAKPVYDESVRIAREDLKSVISQVSKDSIITPDEAAQIRDWWKNRIAEQMAPPPGVPIEEWNKYKETYIDPMAQIIDLGTGVSEFLGKDMSEDMPRALKQITSILIADGKLPPALQLNLIGNLENPLETYKSILGMLNQDPGNGKWADNIKTVMNLDFNGLVNFAQNFETADAGWVDQIKPMAVKEGDNAQLTGTLMQDKVRAMGADPGKAAEGLLSLVVHAGSLGDKTVFSGEFMKQMFDENFFNKIEELTVINPTAGAALKGKMDAMLGETLNAARANINTIARTNGFELRTNNAGEFSLQLTPSLMSEGMKAELDTYFGGSVTAAMAANGVAYGSTGRGGGIVTPNLQTAFNNLTDMNAQLDAYASVENMRNQIFTDPNAEKVNVDRTNQEPGDPTKLSFALPDTVSKDTAFVEAVRAVSANNGIEPEWLMRAIAFETGHSYDPGIQNGYSRATGLIQFIPSTAKGLGTSVEELARMSRDEQMVWVDKYLKPYKGKIKNFGDLYMAIHYPKAVGKDDTYVLYQEGTKAYTGNAGLDTNKDGAVTRAEAIAHVISRTGGGGQLASPQDPKEAAATAARGPDGAAPYQESPRPPAMPTEPAPLGKGSVTVQPGEVTPTDQSTMLDGVKGKPVAQTNREIQDYLNSLVGKEGGIPSFDSEEALQAAMASGQVSSGDLVSVKGKIRTVE